MAWFRNRPLRALAANASYGVAHRLLNIGLRLAYALVLARLLGPADYGLFVYALSWYVLFIPLTNLGQDLELNRVIGRRDGGIGAVLSATFSLRCYAAFAMLLVAIIGGWMLNPGEQGRTLVVLMSLAMLPRALAVWTHTVFRAFERSGLVLRQELLFRPVEIGTGIAVVLLDGGLLMLGLVHVLSWVLQAITGVMLVRGQFVRVHLRARIPDWHKSLGMGVQVGVSRILQNWLQNGPLILYRQVSDDLDNLGLIALCTQLLTVLRMIPSAVAIAAMPFLSRTLARDDGKEVRLLLALAAFSVLQALTAALVLSLAGDSLIVWTFGPAYAGALELLIAVCWLAVPIALGLATERLLGLGHRINRVFLSGLLGAGLMSLLAFYWVGEMGVAGPILASVLGSLVWVLAMASGLERGRGLVSWISSAAAVAAVLVILG